MLSGASNDQPVYSRSDLPQRGFAPSPLESLARPKCLRPRAETRTLRSHRRSFRRPRSVHRVRKPSSTKWPRSSTTLTVVLAAKRQGLRRVEFLGDAEIGIPRLRGTEQDIVAATPVAGTDPKSEGKIAIANRVIEAAPAIHRNPSEPSPRWDQSPPMQISTSPNTPRHGTRSEGPIHRGRKASASSHRTATRRSLGTLRMGATWSKPQTTRPPSSTWKSPPGASPPSLPRTLR